MPPSPPKNPEVSIPDLIHCVHVLAVPIITVIGLLYLIFSEFTVVNFTTAFAIFAGWLLICGLVVCLEKCLKCCTGEGNQLKYCGRSILLGCAGACFAGWASRLVCYGTPFLFPYDQEIRWFTIFVSLPTISIFWAAFVAQIKPKCKVIYRWNEKRPWIIIGINTLVLLVAIRLGMLYQWNNSFRKIMWTNLAFFPICTACMVEFFQVLAGNLQMSGTTVLVASPGSLENGVTDKLVSSAPLINSEEFVDPRLECKICMSEFSEKNIPRMLKECGHTICESCADNLLNQNKGQHLFCPFCQKVTVVNGHGHHLPKNFTIVDMIEEKQRRKNKN